MIKQYIINTMIYSIILCCVVLIWLTSIVLPHIILCNELICSCTVGKSFFFIFSFLILNILNIKITLHKKKISFYAMILTVGFILFFIQLLTKSYCNEWYNYTIFNQNDICSFYYIPTGCLLLIITILLYLNCFPYTPKKYLSYIKKDE